MANVLSDQNVEGFAENDGVMDDNLRQNRVCTEGGDEILQSWGGHLACYQGRRGHRKPSSLKTSNTVDGQKHNISSAKRLMLPKEVTNVQRAARFDG